MRITEKQLRAIVRESIVRTLQEQEALNEGKLGRALGTLALGGALMMGNPQDANAQLDFRTEKKTQEAPAQRMWLYRKKGVSLSPKPGEPLYYVNGTGGNYLNHGNLWLSWEPDRIWLRLYNGSYKVKPFCLGKTPEQGIKTLQSMLSLLGKEQTAYAYDWVHTEYSFISRGLTLYVETVGIDEHKERLEFTINKYEIESGIAVLEQLVQEMDELTPLEKYSFVNDR